MAGADYPDTEPNLARAAALIADGSRARMLMALAAGPPLPAGQLAAAAGISAATASGHLARLLEGGMILVESHGRHRHYRLASPKVAAALEALCIIAPPAPLRGLRASTQAAALRRARTCYDHFAGQFGVTLMRSLLDGGLLTGGDGHFRAATAVRDRPSSYGHDVNYTLTPDGVQTLREFGVDVDRLPSQRPLIRYCVDWSERDHHLSGALGAVITARIFELDWVRRGSTPRIVHVTDAGERGLARVLARVPRRPNLNPSWLTRFRRV